MKRIYTRLMMLSLLLIVIPMANAYARKFIITTQNNTFSPSSITNVAVGDTIQWTLVTGAHTTTSTNIPAGAAAWDSPLNNINPSFVYKVTVAGVYNYICSIHDAFGMKGSFTAAIATGIAEQADSFGDLLLSPNPATDFVRVSFNPQSALKGSVELFDLLGNKLWKSAATFDAGSNSAEINLTGIPKGVYFVALSDNRNNRQVKRLIIR